MDPRPKIQTRFHKGPSTRAMGPWAVANWSLKGKSGTGLPSCPSCDFQYSWMCREHWGVRCASEGLICMYAMWLLCKGRWGELWVCVKERERKKAGVWGMWSRLICVSLCSFLSKCVYIWCDCVCRGLRVLVDLWVWFLSTSLIGERNLDIWLENDKCQLVRMMEAVPGQVFWSRCDVGEEKEMQVKSLSKLKIFFILKWGRLSTSNNNDESS